MKKMSLKYIFIAIILFSVVQALLVNDYSDNNLDTSINSLKIAYAQSSEGGDSGGACSTTTVAEESGRGPCGVTYRCAEYACVPGNSGSCIDGTITSYYYFNSNCQNTSTNTQSNITTTYCNS